MNSKYQAIIDNYINGNREDAEIAIKKLNKRNLILLIEQWAEQEGDNYAKVLLTIYKLLV